MYTYNEWRPEYSEYYYAVDEYTLNSLKSEDNLYLAVHRYMWLDIDDDFQYAKDGLVFRTEEEAMAKAAELYGGKHESVLESNG